VDLGPHISGRTQSLNFGVGLFAGSIFPGSNRMMFTGFSPSWRGFFISSMGGAGLAFDDLGINLVSLMGKSPVPSILYLNRQHGEEIEVEILPVDLHQVWKGAGDACVDDVPSRKGSYALLDFALASFGGRYEGGFRGFAVGPAAEVTDFGAILSAPIKDGRATDVDTWAGRGGLGSKMLQEHGIAAVVYGGTVVGDDFRDRKVADEWFEAKYKQKLAVKDFEATTKYRFDPKFETGGTLGVNYAALGGRLIAFNYRSLTWTEEERVALHERLILGHYLKQFNEETIATKSQATCDEPCSAVCKKMRGEFKKDYEPYQALGPLCGIFDQRAAERLNRASDEGGFDAISLGGVLAWLMDCLDSGDLKGADLGSKSLPRWKADGFDPVADSGHNADLGMDNAGLCRFHRGWAEEMMPEAIGSVYSLKEEYLSSLRVAASRINSRNSAIYWESKKNLEFVFTFLLRRRDVEGDSSPELAAWIASFEKDPLEAGLDYWFDIRKGIIDESLRDFF
jgi:glyceraldehyde-3-phosphate dehydrogenase (ferredoxin)